MSTWIYVVILAVLIILHELGHFWAARRNGIIVEEFGLGLPPKLFSLGRWKGTEFTLNLLPIGGFARMKGEDEDLGEGSFWRAPARARAMVLLAGPLMNIFTAILALTVTYSVVIPGDGVWILDVAPNYPAAGVLQPGDVVLSIDGERVFERSVLTARIREHVSTPAVLEVRRESETFTVQVPTRVDPDGVPRIGVLLASRVPAWKAPWEALRELGYFLWNMVRLPGRLLAGQVAPEEARPLGPVGIGKLFVDVVEQQPTPRVRLFTILRLMGIISFALGVTNLLPIPALDGGRLLFVLLEMLRRGKRISPAREGLVHLIGMALLLTLMAVITYYDLRYPPGI